MAKHELRLSTEDIETRGPIEIAIEYYENDDHKDGISITFLAKEDYRINGSLGQNEQLLIVLATAFKKKIRELI